jgi:hypothetical protein
MIGSLNTSEIGTGWMMLWFSDFVYAPETNACQSLLIWNVPLA